MKTVNFDIFDVPLISGVRQSCFVFSFTNFALYQYCGIGVLLSFSRTREVFMNFFDQLTF